MIFMADCVPGGKQAAKLLSQTQRHVEAVCGPSRDGLVVIVLLGSISQCLLLLLSVLD